MFYARFNDQSESDFITAGTAICRQNNHLGDGSIDDTKVSANNDSSMNDAMLQMIQASSLSDSKNHSLDPCSIHGPTSKLPEFPPQIGGMCS